MLPGRVYADFRHNEHYFDTMFDLILSLYQIRPTIPSPASCVLRCTDSVLPWHLHRHHRPPGSDQPVLSILPHDKGDEPFQSGLGAL